MIGQGRRGAAQETKSACGERRQAQKTKKAGALVAERRKRVNWLSISPSKLLRTNRQCLDCWAL
jgi:hypothetical protein